MKQPLPRVIPNRSGNQRPRWLVFCGLGAIALLMSSPPVTAQSEGYCFLRDPTGRVYDLGPLCNVNQQRSPSPPQTASPPPTAPAAAADSQSPLRITLRWATIDDLDLALLEPNDDEVSIFSPVSESGGTLLADANGSCLEPTPTPEETIIWAAEAVPGGSYTIFVTLFLYCQDTPALGPIPFTVEVVSAAGVQQFEGSVSDRAPIARFSFDLP